MNNFWNKVAFFSVIWFFLSVPSLAQDLMSYEQYQQIDHGEPYIYQIELNTWKLLYFGSRHSFDPQDQQMDTLAQKFKQFAPDIVITEAFPENFDFSLDMEEAIKNSGEFGLTWKLADEQNIPIQSMEPTRKKEVEHLKHQGWSDTQLMLYYTLRQVAQSQDQRDSLDSQF